LFDSNNLCDVRDLSLEKLIGVQLQQTATSGSASSNDTLNEDFFNNENDLYAVATTDDDQDDPTPSQKQQQQHMLSLLINNTSSKANELKRQFIHDQLESIRKQKEQLQLQIQDQQEQNQQQQIQNISKKNLFDLSTIKEVDTPISERNLKLTKNNKILDDESVADDTINTLENVSKLSDSSLTSINNYKRTSSSNQLKKQITEADRSALSDSSSLISLTPSQSTTTKSSISKPDKSSTSTIKQQKTLADVEQTPQMLNAELIRQKYAQLFNVSLFESSTSSNNSSSSSLKSPMIANLTDMNQVEYGQLIYDSLQTNNLTLSTSRTSCNTSKQHISSLMSSTANTSNNAKPASFQTSIFT